MGPPAWPGAPWTLRVDPATAPQFQDRLPGKSGLCRPLEAGILATECHLPSRGREQDRPVSPLPPEGDTGSARLPFAAWGRGQSWEGASEGGIPKRESSQGPLLPRTGHRLPRGSLGRVWECGAQPVLTHSHSLTHAHTHTQAWDRRKSQGSQGKGFLRCLRDFESLPTVPLPGAVPGAAACACAPCWLLAQAPGGPRQPGSPPTPGTASGASPLTSPPSPSLQLGDCPRVPLAPASTLLRLRNSGPVRLPQPALGAGPSGRPGRSLAETAGAGEGRSGRASRSVPVPPWRCLQGDVLTTVYHVDLGDGFRAVYSNLTVTKEPIRHAYENPGIYRVSVRAENLAGHDEAVLFVQVTGASSLLGGHEPLPGTERTWAWGWRGSLRAAAGPAAAHSTPLEATGRGQAGWAQVHTPGVCSVVGVGVVMAVVTVVVMWGW